MNAVQAATIDAVIIDELARRHDVTQLEDELFTLLSQNGNFREYVTQAHNSIRNDIGKVQAGNINPVGIHLYVSIRPRLEGQGYVHTGG